MIVQIGEYISQGAQEFLIQEYIFLAMFIATFAGIILVAVDWYGTGYFSFYTATAFIIGAVTSTACGFIGM